MAANVVFVAEGSSEWTKGPVLRLQNKAKLHLDYTEAIEIGPSQSLGANAKDCLNIYQTGNRSFE